MDCCFVVTHGERGGLRLFVFWAGRLSRDNKSREAQVCGMLRLLKLSPCSRILFPDIALVTHLR